MTDQRSDVIVKTFNKIKNKINFRLIIIEGKNKQKLKNI